MDSAHETPVFVVREDAIILRQLVRLKGISKLSAKVIWRVPS